MATLLDIFTWNRSYYCYRPVIQITILSLQKAGMWNSISYIPWSDCFFRSSLALACISFALAFLLDSGIMLFIPETNRKLHPNSMILHRLERNQRLDKSSACPLLTKIRTTLHRSVCAYAFLMFTRIESFLEYWWIHIMMWLNLRIILLPNIYKLGMGLGPGGQLLSKRWL